MKGYRQRIIGVMLTVCLLMGLLPLSVSAATEPAYYGREALADMDNGRNLVFAYDRLAEGIADMEESISLQSFMRAVSVDEIATVFDAYYYDHGEAYYLAGGYSYQYNTMTQYVTNFMPTYHATTTADQQAFEDTLADIVVNAGITDDMSNYEKSLILHDALTDQVTYSLSSTLPHTAYGAVIEGQAVCDGYSKAYQCLLRQVGISSHIVVGYSVNPSTNAAEGHAWNLVELDGAYYYTDVTWDDQDGDRYYMYLNVTEEVLEEDHRITVPDYGLPTCTATAANYFTHHPEHISTTEGDVEQVASLFGDEGFARLYVTGDDPTAIWDWYTENAAAIARQRGIVGRYQYGCSWLGREFHLTMTGNDQPISVPTAVSGLTYSGSLQTGVPTGTGYTVTGNTAVNAGNYTATLTPNYGYTWNDGSTDAKEIAWSIAPKTVSAEDIAIVTIADEPYTGEAIEPSVTVTCNGEPLRNGKDYALTYTDNTNAGDATVILTPTGTGNYIWDGEITATFTITPVAGAISLQTANGQDVLTVTPPDILDPATQLVTSANSTGVITLKYYTNADCTDGESLTPPTEAGQYWIKAFLAADTNHTAAESLPLPCIIKEPAHYGWVDSDTTVSASDALLTLQAATSRIALTEEQRTNADVDKQAGVSSADALLILQYATQKIGRFPCEE